MARRQAAASGDDTLEGESGEPRVYELGFHLDSELPVEEAKKAYAALRALVGDGGEIIAESEPQMIPLAYTISRQETAGRRDFDSAYFSWIAYEAPPEAHEAVIAAARGEARIIRFIDLATTKDAARHAQELREIAEKAVAAHTEGEEEAPAAEAELDAALEHAAL